jgi:hypothetical protein
MGQRFLTFQRILVPSSPRPNSQREILLRQLSLEDDGSTIL